MSTNKVYKRKRVSFLKVYPVVREVVSAIKGITKKDFDLIMYLDDLVYFRRKDFREGIFWGGWDPYKFKRLQEQGFIDKVQGTGTGKGNPTKYKLTLASRTMVTNVYKMCYLEKEIPESIFNPIMKSKSRNHRKMAKFITKHNKQLRHEKRKRNAYE